MRHRLIFLSGLFASVLTLGGFTNAQAQFTYTYYSADTTIDGEVDTTFAIVGYGGGGYDENTFERQFTSPSSPTVQVVDGADVLNEVDMFNHSVVNLQGGNVTFAFAFDDSTLNISGGTSLFVLGQERSVIHMSGGSVDDLEGQGKRIDVSGGSVGTLVANGATDYLGNSIGACVVNLTGGTIGGEVDAYNDGILNIRGGNLGSDLRAAEGGTINIYGSGLAASLVSSNSGNGYSLYTLSGMLEDGTALDGNNLYVRNDGVTYGHSSFNLINSTVPDPATCAALGFGVLALLRRRR